MRQLFSLEKKAKSTAFVTSTKLNELKNETWWKKLNIMKEN